MLASMKSPTRHLIALLVSGFAASCVADVNALQFDDPDAPHRKETPDWEVGPDAAACGNGIVDPREQCDGPPDMTCAELDDRYSTGEAGCTDSCTWDYSDCGASECGNALHESGEECDEGRTRNLCPEYGEDCELCTVDCVYGPGEAAFCGDGHHFFGEELCDPTVPLRCTDHGYDGGEVGCSDDCSEYDYAACEGDLCGDGVVGDSEECDAGDANTFACEYGERECEVCTPFCEIAGGEVSFCGDGDVHEREDCDPPGSTGDLFCPGSTVPAVCSDICKWEFEDCGGEGDPGPDVGTEPEPDTGVDVGTRDVSEGSGDAGASDDVGEPRPRDERGCATAGSRGSAWLGLALLGFVRRRR